LTNTLKKIYNMKDLLKTALIVGGTILVAKMIDKKLKENDIDLIEEAKKLIKKQLEPKTDEEPS